MGSLLPHPGQQRPHPLQGGLGPAPWVAVWNSSVLASCCPHKAASSLHAGSLGFSGLRGPPRLLPCPRAPKSPPSGLQPPSAGSQGTLEAPAWPKKAIPRTPCPETPTCSLLQIFPTRNPPLLRYCSAPERQPHVHPRTPGRAPGGSLGSTALDLRGPAAPSFPDLSKRQAGCSGNVPRLGTWSWSPSPPRPTLPFSSPHSFHSQVLAPAQESPATPLSPTWPELWS